MHPIIERLDRALAANYPELYRTFQPGVSPAELDEIARPLSSTLPPLYRELYLWRNGNVALRRCVPIREALEEHTPIGQRSPEPGVRPSSQI